MINEDEIDKVAMAYAKAYIEICHCEGKRQVATALSYLIATCAAGVAAALGDAECVAMLSTLIEHIKETPQKKETVQ